MDQVHGVVHGPGSWGGPRTPVHVLYTSQTTSEFPTKRHPPPPPPSVLALYIHMNYKLSQIAYNEIIWEENKAFWSKKIKRLLEQIVLGDVWMKAHYGDKDG